MMGFTWSILINEISTFLNHGEKKKRDQDDKTVFTTWHCGEIMG